MVLANEQVVAMNLPKPFLRASAQESLFALSLTALCLPLTLPAQLSSSKPLSPEVVSAWEKAGAEAGWIGPVPEWPEHLIYRHDAKGRRGEVAAFTALHYWRFRIPVCQPLSFDKLPAPTSAFGLQYSFSEPTKAEIEALARMSNLQILDLAYSNLTDAGLEGLMKLKNLRCLDLQGTSVSDAGVKCLASFL
jgi:hypothetical protein